MPLESPNLHIPGQAHGKRMDDGALNAFHLPTTLHEAHVQKYAYSDLREQAIPRCTVAMFSKSGKDGS